jgi:hypothetical protein
MTFRQWCQEMWYKHIDELDAYNMRPQFTSQQYFNTYKFWLKREYRHQQGEK